MKKEERFVCVVPVYNEADLITETVKGLKKIKGIDEIVIINDGSQDNTLDVINTLGVSVINLNKNHGKGYAMKTAIDSLEYDYIGFIDGDLGKTSVEIEKLMTPVINGDKDVYEPMYSFNHLFKSITHESGVHEIKELLK